MKVDVTNNIAGLNGASLFIPTKREPETLKFIDKTKLLLTEDDVIAALNVTRNHWFILQAITAFRDKLGLDIELSFVDQQTGYTRISSIAIQIKFKRDIQGNPGFIIIELVCSVDDTVGFTFQHDKDGDLYKLHRETVFTSPPIDPFEDIIAAYNCEGGCRQPGVYGDGYLKGVYQQFVAFVTKILKEKKKDLNYNHASIPSLRKISEPQQFDSVMNVIRKDYERVRDYHAEVVQQRKLLCEDQERIAKKIKETDEFIKTLEPEVEQKKGVVRDAYNNLIKMIKTGFNVNEKKEEEKDDDSSCSICFEKYEKGKHQRSCITLCGHQFCNHCIYSFSGTCPTCRKPFKKDKIVKLF